MPKYTFIIPVYNVESYLSECIESIHCQTFSDYAIILVDDGSTDSSGKLCDSYATRFEKITVIHQKNAGLSEARNAGLKAASSVYVIFLDSDDYWSDSHGLEEIDAIVEPDTDVLAFASKDYNQRTGVITDDRYDYPSELNAMESERCLEYMITHDRFNLSAAKKVFRREFLINNQLFFEAGIKCEDIEQGLRIANCLPHYRFLNAKLYVYRHRENSISTSVDAKHLDDYFYIIKKYASFSYVSENVRRLLLSYVGYQYALLLGYTKKSNTDNKSLLFKELRQYSYLLSYKGYKRTEKVNKFYQVFGLQLTALCLGFYLKYK